MRCWTDRGLNHLRLDNGASFLLCRQCREGAPRDREVFEKMYLHYASTKELLRRFSVDNEVEAVERLAAETGIDPARAKEVLLGITAKKGDARRVLSWLEMTRPFGYRPTHSGWTLKEDEARVVTRIYQLYLDGKGILKICEDLNKNRSVKTKMGRSWKPQTVANILKNPVYCGFSRLGKRVPHPPIVTVRDFNRAQSELDRRIRRPDQKVEHRKLDAFMEEPEAPREGP
jgi:hypothetical protein